MVFHAPSVVSKGHDPTEARQLRQPTYETAPLGVGTDVGVVRIPARKLQELQQLCGDLKVADFSDYEIGRNLQLHSVHHRSFIG